MRKKRIKIIYHALSEKGVREKNEDAYIAGKVGDSHVFAVADGLGGHASGESASRIAISELKEAIERYGEEGLTIAFERANNKIFLENRRKGTNMGTTLVACIVGEDGKCKIANVGDSRAYIFENHDIWRTKDHSLVQELIDKGVISEEEAFTHPRKNIVTRVLGLGEKIKVDSYEKNLEKSVLLLCSDGLSDYLKDHEIAKTAKSHNPKKACKKLCKMALKAGSKDNITVVVVRRKRRLVGR